MMNNTVLNKVRVKSFIIECANGNSPTPVMNTDGWNTERAMRLLGGRKFTQVSDELLEEIDVAVRKLINERVCGKTQTGKMVR